MFHLCGISWLAQPVVLDQIRQRLRALLFFSLQVERPTFYSHNMIFDSTFRLDRGRAYNTKESAVAAVTAAAPKCPDCRSWLIDQTMTALCDPAIQGALKKYRGKYTLVGLHVHAASKTTNPPVVVADLVLSGGHGKWYFRRKRIGVLHVP